LGDNDPPASPSTTAANVRTNPAAAAEAKAGGGGARAAASGGGDYGSTSPNNKLLMLHTGHFALPKLYLDPLCIKAITYHNLLPNRDLGEFLFDGIRILKFFLEGGAVLKNFDPSVSREIVVTTLRYLCADSTPVDVIVTESHVCFENPAAPLFG
jgi:hypothetical protein